MRTVRMTLAQIAEQGELSASGQLRVNGAEVAVAYFRAGYSPNDYPTDVEWKARLAPAPPRDHVICYVPSAWIASQ